MKQVIMFLAGIVIGALGMRFIPGISKLEPPVFNFKNHPINDSTKGITVLSTDYLAWPDASKMIKAYSTHPSSLKVTLPDGSVKLLESLQLDADYVRGMLSDLTVRRLELFFGVNKADLANPASKQTFTIITAPVFFDVVKKDYMVKKYRDLAGSRTDPDNSEIIDFCDPCPKNCPDTTQK